MRKIAAVLIISGLVLAACGPEEEGDETPEAAPTTSPTVDECATENLTLVNPGQLTIGTDNPAFPPWFEGGTPEGSSWEINDPSTGEGFESAVAHAVAGELGFGQDEVTWVEVPFNQAFAPGPTDFDFDINQVSYRPRRDEAVDFSDSYYDVNQALVAVADTPIAEAATVEELKQYTLGAPVGTTSFEYIDQNIQPDSDPRVYDTLNDSISGLENEQVDGIVVDLPTAFFIVAVQLDNGTIVGQFPTVGQQEYFGMVFEEGNPLRDCVNQALNTLREDGTLDSIQQEWLADKTDAPVLE